MEERNIPMLILESDFGTADTGQMKTRIEAFIEILTGVM
jgi:benzoyl-CoA reductase/2-hydroxyglutaryl-CoA dehydratase subunit BcrC/BadD/HgdB